MDTLAPVALTVVAPAAEIVPAVWLMPAPPACSCRVPVVLRLCARVRPAELPSSRKKLAVRFPGVVKAAALCNWIAPEPTLMSPAGRVKAPPLAKNDRLALARLRVNPVTTSALSSDTAMLPPDTVMLLKSLPECVREISPVPALIVVGPAATTLPIKGGLRKVCRMSAFVEARVRVPADRTSSSSAMPPADVIDTLPPVDCTGPVVVMGLAPVPVIVIVPLAVAPLRLNDGATFLNVIVPPEPAPRLELRLTSPVIALFCPRMISSSARAARLRAVITPLIWSTRPP